MIDSVSPQTLTPSESRLKRRRQSSMASESPRELGHMRKWHDTGSATFVGSGSGIHFVRTVRQAFARNSRRPSLSHDANDEELVPGEDDHQGLPRLLWRADEVLFPTQGSGHQVANPNPTFDDMVRWTRPYFASWHPPFPYLHAPTFLGLLEKMSTHSLSGLEHTDRVIIRSAMSISAADRRQAPPEEGYLPPPAHLLYQSVEEAVSALQSLLIQPSSVPTLQAAVSIQLFLISMLRLNTASRMGGMIVRMSYHLGLHRCSFRFPQFSTTEREMRRRLFWSIYCIERYLSQALGQPLELKDDDLDVCFPDKELHTDEHTLEPNPQSSQAERQDGGRLMLPTALARHGRIKGLILELRNKSIRHSHADPDEIAYIDAEISKWWNDTQELLNPLSVDEPIMWSSQTQDPEGYRTKDAAPCSLKDSHKLLLLVQKHELIMLLDRPVITSGFNTPAHASAVQKCIGASKSIIAHVYQHINKGMKADGSQNGRIHDPLVWPGFVWLIWQSGLILLYAAFEGHYSVSIAQRETDCCIAILQNLGLRGNFWPSACSAAIKELQTSLYAKTVGEAGAGPEPGRNPTESRYSLIPAQPNSAPWERSADSNQGRVSSTDRYNATSRIETRPHATPRVYEPENRSNESSNRAADLSHAHAHVSNYASLSESQRVTSGMPRRAGSTSRTEYMTNQRTETPTNGVYNNGGPSMGNRPTMNGHFEGAGDVVTVFEDVSQLMDMLHTVNDPFLQPELGVFDMPGYHPSQQSVNWDP